MGLLYAIGDIHGRLDRLEALLGMLPLDPEDRLLFLGDYVDRGPESHGVIERLVSLASERECIFLMGNHESMFLDFLGWEGRAYFAGEAFLANGGAETLLSYGYFEQAPASPRDFKMPETHAAFFRGLALSHREGDYIFVHAGLGRELIRAGSDIDWVMRRARIEELLWDRATFDLPHELGVTIVYGHTPAPDFRVRWNEPFSVGIDTGAAYGGPLTALRLPDETIFQS